MTYREKEIYGTIPMWKATGLLFYTHHHGKTPLEQIRDQAIKQKRYEQILLLT